ncbi:MAG: SgcJ/EcaC family oxidoreductase [Hyphomicrobiaceae bacterium]
MTIDPKKAKQMADAYTAAWNSGSAQAVAEFYAKDGGIIINRGEPWQGRDRVAQMAAGFFSDVPDIKIVCDGLRCAGDHVVYLWTFTGTHAGTKRPLRVSGWEEWDLDPDYRVKASHGWYDADDYTRQTGG